MDPIEITVDKWQLKVSVLTLGKSLVVARMQREALAHPVEDFDVQVMRVQFYPVLFGCSECLNGFLPTEDEFFGMSADSANQWFEAVLKLNPTALPTPPSSDNITPEEAETALVLEKKG